MELMGFLEKMVEKSVPRCILFFFLIIGVERALALGSLAMIPMVRSGLMNRCVLIFPLAFFVKQRCLERSRKNWVLQRVLRRGPVLVSSSFSIHPSELELRDPFLAFQPLLLHAWTYPLRCVACT